MSNPKTPPPGIPAGLPSEPLTGQPMEGLPPGALPANAISPDQLPDSLPPLPGGAAPAPGPGQGKIRMKTMPKMNAGPYLKRAFKLLGGHKALVVLSLFLSLVIFLLPFIAAAAFGPLLKLFGDAAGGASNGDWSNVWTRTGSFYERGGGGDGFFSPITNWLSTPLSFLTIFLIWTCAIVFREVVDILRAWVDANLEQKLLTGLRQNLYEHIQGLSLDFFMGGQTGALMQRVLSETTAVQRLLTQVLLTPVIDAIVLVIVIAYLLALSWQMTLVLFVLAPLTILMFRFTSGKLQEGAMGINMSARELGAELEETINGISDIQVFNAQPKRNVRFREASKEAAKNTASTTAWMSLSNSGAQVFISLTAAPARRTGCAAGCGASAP